MTLLSRCLRIFRNNGILWGSALLSSRVVSVTRSKIASVALGAPNIYLGGRAKISGVRKIRFGRNIYISGSVWIDAITEYGEVSFEPSLSIGDSVSFSTGVHISCIDRVEIGSNVLLGSHVYISDHGHGSYAGELHSNPDSKPTQRLLGGGGPVLVEENVWIGDNVIIIGPVKIGRGSIVGANSVVRKDIPAETVAAGAPAKPIKVFDRSLQKWTSL